MVCAQTYIACVWNGTSLVRQRHKREAYVSISTHLHTAYNGTCLNRPLEGPLELAAIECGCSTEVLCNMLVYTIRGLAGCLGRWQAYLTAL